MYILLIVLSIGVFFFLVQLGGSILETRDLMPSELQPFQDMLEAMFMWLFDFVGYILAYFI